MRKLKNILMAAVTAVAVIGSLSVAVYTVKLAERIEQVSRTSRADMNYLRGCIRDLEGELTATLIDRVMDRMNEGSLPVGGDEENGAAAPPSETEAESVQDVMARPESETAPETEAMTLPTHNHPETLPPESDESDTRQMLYTIGAYEGRIGIFDVTGQLIRTVNVFLFSLPEADREILTVGIPAYSQEEMAEIVGRYE